MDKAGTALSDEDLLGERIEREPAERGDALGGRIDGREQRHLAGNAVDSPDRPRPAALVGRTELAGQELRAARPGMDALDDPALVGNVERETIARGRSQIDVRLRGAVERDAEDLADLR